MLFNNIQLNNVISNEEFDALFKSINKKPLNIEQFKLARCKK